jgi:hypothetical protein
VTAGAGDFFMTQPVIHSQQFIHKSARKFAAAAELYQRRLAEQDAEDREQWCIDGWEQVAAEVAAAQGISRGRAAGQLLYGLALAERLPKLGGD